MKDFLHHLFVPRHSNNHRSKLLHHETLFLSIALLIATLLVIGGAEKQYPTVLGDSTQISIADLLTYTNIERQNNGLPPVIMNDALSDAAVQKAAHMFANDYWAHVAPDGTTPWVFIKGSGYEYLYAGENLARGFDSGPEVVQAWMDSPSHRENLLSPNYTDIGFAVREGTLTGTDTILVVQMFGSPYLDDETAQSGQSTNGSVTPTPTQLVVAQNNPKPSEVPVVLPEAQNQSLTEVASIKNEPLIDSDTVKNNIGYFFLGLFITVLAIDAAIVKRKQIARVFTHNVDHILFLLFILLAGILIGRGAVI